MRDLAPDALIGLGAAAAAATRAGTCTAEALAAACLARIGAREPSVRAFAPGQPSRPPALGFAKSSFRAVSQGLAIAP